MNLVQELIYGLYQCKDESGYARISQILYGLERYQWAAVAEKAFESGYLEYSPSGKTTAHITQTGIEYIEKIIAEAEKLIE